MEAQSGGSPAKVVAGLLYAVAIIFFIVGFYVMYTYGDGSKYTSDGLVGHVVGGDAYNYIIIGLRGLGFMMVGLASAVVGAAMSVVGAMLKPTPKPDPAQTILPRAEVEQQLRKLGIDPSKGTATTP